MRRAGEVVPGCWQPHPSGVPCLWRPIVASWGAEGTREKPAVLTRDRLEPLVAPGSAGYTTAPGAAVKHQKSKIRFTDWDAEGRATHPPRRAHRKGSREGGCAGAGRTDARLPPGPRRDGEPHQRRERTALFTSCPDVRRADPRCQGPLPRGTGAVERVLGAPPPPGRSWGGTPWSACRSRTGGAE